MASNLEEELKKALIFVQQSMQQGDYGAVLSLTESIKKGLGNLPREMEEIQQKAYAVGAQKELEFARRDLGKGDYLTALARLRNVEVCSKKSKKELPADLPALWQQARTMGIEHHLTASDTALGADNYQDALTELDNAEILACSAGISLPDTFGKKKQAATDLMRTKGIKNFYDQETDASPEDILENYTAQVEQLVQTGNMFEHSETRIWLDVLEQYAKEKRLPEQKKVTALKEKIRYSLN